jgi:hypothetical protein
MPSQTQSQPTPKRTEGDEWLSLRDAAQMMGVHPATLRTWADLPTEADLRVVPDSPERLFFEGFAATFFSRRLGLFALFALIGDRPPSWPRQR